MCLSIMAIVLSTKEPQVSYHIQNIKQTVIQEQKRPYIKHDQLFKELISHFLEEFIEVFFPAFYPKIDFSNRKQLSGELFTDLMDGSNRQVDLAIEVKLKGEDTLIVIHIEAQSSYQEDFNLRMFRYFSLLHEKYKKPILPIVVFSYDYQREEKASFHVDIHDFQVLSFNFLMVELKKKNWRDYLRSDNPVAAALLSKMGYSETEKVEVKKEFLRMLVRMKLDPARTRFINDFFENYLILNEEEEEMLMLEINQLDDAHEFTKLPNSWENRGIKKGLKQGLEKGVEKGRSDVAVEMLKEGLSVELIAKVTHLDQETIEKLREKLIE